MPAGSTISTFFHVVREALLGESSTSAKMRWLQLNGFVRYALLIIAASIIAGILLRLSGFVGGSYSWFVFTSASNDSWMPMGHAYDRITGASAGTVRDLFFVDNVKFQYPISSLLLYSLVDSFGFEPSVETMNALVWACIFCLPFVIFAICTASIQQLNSSLQFSSRDRFAMAAGFAVATLFFYPVMISWRLGQIQAMLNLAFALACLCWIYERKIASGIFIGLSCLIKPQFSLFFVWAVLRGQKRFAIGQAGAAGCGLLLSLGLYGWDNHIYYLEVLQYISRRGEIFWDNSSVNGLMNGIIYPDRVLEFDYKSFPPYHPAVYFPTLITSLLIIAAALFVNRTSKDSGTILDFMTAGLSFTLASPIAWGHHYGVALPILAVTVIHIVAKMDGTRRRNYLIGWAACFILFSNYWNISEVLANTSAAILQNWRLFAVFGLLWTLYRLQSGRLAWPSVPRDNATVVN